MRILGRVIVAIIAGYFVLMAGVGLAGSWVTRNGDRLATEMLPIVARTLVSGNPAPDLCTQATWADRLACRAFLHTLRSDDRARRPSSPAQPSSD